MEYLDYLAVFCAVALKGVILYKWEQRKLRHATPGKQTITLRKGR